MLAAESMPRTPHHFLGAFSKHYSYHISTLRRSVRNPLHGNIIYNRFRNLQGTARLLSVLCCSLALASRRLFPGPYMTLLCTPYLYWTSSPGCAVVSMRLKYRPVYIKLAISLRLAHNVLIAALFKRLCPKAQGL